MFSLRYVLPTFTPLALSSLIINSKSAKGLPDFIIANAFVNKIGKCSLSLVESNFLLDLLLIHLQFFLSWYYWKHFLLFGENGLIVYTDFADSQHEMKNSHIQMGCFWSPPQKGYTMKEVPNVCNGSRHTKNKSLCPYFRHEFSIDENFAFTWLAKR